MMLFPTNPTELLLLDDPETTTVVACALNAAMESDSNARARYLEIYGEEWAPLGNGMCLPHKFSRARMQAAPTRIAKGSR